MKRFTVLWALVAMILGLAGSTRADSIYMLGDGHGMRVTAQNHLTNLGHTVTFGGGATLANYSAYDQVWDLRYNTALTAADATAMGNFLAGGGRLYLTGEHSGFATRNTSIDSFINAIGGGDITLSNSGVSGLQTITAAGQAVNAPNVFTSVNFNAAEVVAAGTQGFNVTQTSPGSGVGSLLGWDFGDITGKSGARMLVGFDIEIFQNGQAWTQNMATYLAADANPGVPLPGTVAASAVILGGLFTARPRRSAKVN